MFYALLLVASLVATPATPATPQWYALDNTTQECGPVDFEGMRTPSAIVAWAQDGGADVTRRFAQLKGGGVLQIVGIDDHVNPVFFIPFFSTRADCIIYQQAQSAPGEQTATWFDSYS